MTQIITGMSTMNGGKKFNSLRRSGAGEPAFPFTEQMLSFMKLFIMPARQREIFTHPDSSS